MKYENADYVLPAELVQHIQQYIQGTYLYIPVQEEYKKPWGACSGSRAMLRKNAKRRLLRFIILGFLHNIQKRVDGI